MGQRGLNVCIFTGTVGREPEVRYTQGGMAIASFSIAVGGSKKEGDKYVDHTEWVNLKAFGKTAETVGQYCPKGSPVYVRCRVQEESWVDKETQKKRFKTIFVIDELVLGPKRQGTAPSTAPRAAAPAPGAAAPAGGGGGFDVDDDAAPASDGFIDDDLPF